MAYHADFWIVVGTASPVIILAAVVSASDSMTINGPRSGKHPHRRDYARPLYYHNAFIVLLQALGLLAALSSLANERDAYSLTWVTFFELVSVCLLLMGAVLAQVYRKMFGVKAGE